MLSSYLKLEFKISTPIFVSQLEHLSHKGTLTETLSYRSTQEINFRYMGHNLSGHQLKITASEQIKQHENQQPATDVFNQVSKNSNIENLTWNLSPMSKSWLFP